MERVVAVISRALASRVMASASAAAKGRRISRSVCRVGRILDDRRAAAAWEGAAGGGWTGSGYGDWRVGGRRRAALRASFMRRSPITTTAIVAMIQMAMNAR